MKFVDLCKPLLIHPLGVPSLAYASDRYFQAARPSSIARGIYSVALPSVQSLSERAPIPKPTDPTALTDESTLAWHSASFSPKGGYYVLNYDGPGVPWQRVVGVETKGQSMTTSRLNECDG